MLEFLDLAIQDDIFIEEHLTQIHDRKEQVLHNKVIPQVKVLWSYRGTKDVTLKRKDKIREIYPELFRDEV